MGRQNYDWGWILKGKSGFFATFFDKNGISTPFSGGQTMFRTHIGEILSELTHIHSLHHFLFPENIHRFPKILFHECEKLTVSHCLSAHFRNAFSGKRTGLFQQVMEF
jgi:hypothetical protein